MIICNTKFKKNIRDYNNLNFIIYIVYRKQIVDNILIKNACNLFNGTNKQRW